MMRYKPSSLVVAFFEMFVAGFRAVTVALATTAFVGSVTVPCRSAAFDCACPKATWAERRRTINKQGIWNDPLSRDFNETNIVVSPSVFCGSGIRAVTSKLWEYFCRVMCPGIATMTESRALAQPLYSKRVNVARSYFTRIYADC